VYDLNKLSLKKAKAITLHSLLIALCVIICTSCLDEHDRKMGDILTQQEQIKLDPSLRQVLERDTLVALTDYNSTNYFIYRGEPMGYQYEMLKQFSEYIGVNLKLVISNDMNTAFDLLNDGEVDVIAMGLTVTRDRQQVVDFTVPQIQTKQVLVQRKPENWRKMRTWDEIEEQLIRNPLELAGKDVYVQKGTIFANRLSILANEIGDTIHIHVDHNREVEQLITAVARSEIDFTVSDEHIAKVNQKYYPNLDVRTAISFPQHVAWAVRHGSDSLRNEINGWLLDYKKSTASRYVYNKYFNNPRSVNITQSEYHSIGGGKISQYDEIIRELSEAYELDWRLVASLIYQESRFHMDATSWVGAFGLMQLMPATAEIYGVDTSSSPAEQISAGIQFLKWLDKHYRDSVVRYGYARGEETYNFVVEIFERYEHYKKVIEN